MLTARLVVSACFAAAMVQVQPALAQAGGAPDKVSFYFAAHEDDWQLFMNPSAFLDVVDGKTKTVFIHTTAGDAGLGMNTGGRKKPYYMARENGAEAAIRFMADSGEYPLSKTLARMSFNGHQVDRMSYRNAVAYFLRAPDGHPSGSGYRLTGNQSLERLAKGEIGTLSAVDSSTVYRGWTDFVSTLRSLLDFERGRASSIKVNVAELDSSINPGDHSDHRMTAKAALDAAQGLACAQRFHYVDYASSRLPENLSPQLRDMESSVVAVTAAGIVAMDHGSIWQQYYRSYLGRNYFRLEEGTGRCENPALPSTVVSRQLRADRTMK